MIAAVRAVIAAATLLGIEAVVSGSMSANTVWPRRVATAFAVAANVNDGTITSSPGPIRRRAVRDEGAGPGVDRYASPPATIWANSSSNAATSGSLHEPSRWWSTAVAAAISSGPIVDADGRHSGHGCLSHVPRPRAAVRRSSMKDAPVAGHRHWTASLTSRRPAGPTQPIRRAGCRRPARSPTRRPPPRSRLRPRPNDRSSRAPRTPSRPDGRPRRTVTPTASQSAGTRAAAVGTDRAREGVVGQHDLGPDEHTVLEPPRARRSGRSSGSFRRSPTRTPVPM